MAYTALLDACVLYPNPVRDLLMRLAVTDLYRVKWSADIHAEWMRNLAANRPDIPQVRIDRLRDLMDAHVRDAIVDNYAPLIPSLILPDPNDRHVLAAAITGRADVIVTFNLKDFPEAALAPFGIEVQHPDQFLRHQFDLKPELVCAVVRDLHVGLKKPPYAVPEYLAMLERHTLYEFAAALRSHAVAL